MRNARNTYKLLVWMAVAIIPLSCTFIKREPPIGQESAATAPSHDQQFDPLGLPQDSIIVTQLEPTTTPAETLAPGPIDSSITPSGNSRISGEDMSGGDNSNSQVYRVQLLTLNSYGDGRRALAVAEEIFDQTAVLDYEVPYYKLRVGQFATRAEAEVYLQRARTAGYDNALVAMCTIGIREVSPVYDPSSGSAKSPQVQSEGANAPHK